MTVALVEVPRRRRRPRDSPKRDCLVEARGLRRAIVAATRAGRSEAQIASEAGVQTRAVRELRGGATFATPALARKLSRVLCVWESKLVVDARGGHLPYAILSPLVEEAVERHGVERTAHLSGIPSRRLHSLRSGETRLVTLAVADRIILGLDSPLLWWQDEQLRRWAHATTVRV